MRGFAMLKIGSTGWIEKEVPAIGPYDALVEPLALAPCPPTSTRYTRVPSANATTSSSVTKPWVKLPKWAAKLKTSNPATK